MCIIFVAADANRYIYICYFDSQELNKCKTELQYWRSKSPAIPVYFGCAGQSLPVPTDDFQSLANPAGVMSNVEASINEGLDFIPIADVAARNSSERELDGMLSMPSAQLPQASSSSTSTSTLVSLESMAPPKAPPPLMSALSLQPLVNSAKRKSSTSSSLSVATSSSLQVQSSEEEAAAIKKPRRVLKSRQAKRSKI